MYTVLVSVSLLWLACAMAVAYAFSPTAWTPPPAVYNTLFALSILGFSATMALLALGEFRAAAPTAFTAQAMFVSSVWLAARPKDEPGDGPSGPDDPDKPDEPRPDWDAFDRARRTWERKPSGVA